MFFDTSSGNALCALPLSDNTCKRKRANAALPLIAERMYLHYNPAVKDPREWLLIDNEFDTQKAAIEVAILYIKQEQMRART